MKAVTFTLILFAGITAFARSSPPPNPFQALTQIIVEKGKPTETFRGIYLTLSERLPLPEPGAHQAEYISTVGGYDKTGKYQFNRVEVVAEQWRPIAQGRWEINQWLFAADAQGDISFARHVHMIETANGTVLIHETIPSTPDEEKLQWDLQLNNWYTRLLSPPSN